MNHTVPLIRMRWLIILGLISIHHSSSQYVPGTPGAPWTQEELLVVRSKLWRLYSKNSYLVSLWRQGLIPNDLPPPDVTADLKFFPAKVLRLRY